MQAMPRDPEAPEPAALAVSAALFYAAMTAVGCFGVWAQGLDVAGVLFGAGEAVWTDAALGAGGGLLLVMVTRLTRRLAAFRHLEGELTPLLGRPGPVAIAVLAVTSAIGEEVLFRGALQALLGFWPTVLLFGGLHGAFSRRLRAWAIFATVAGLSLGFLAAHTGNLLAPVLCHLTVNYWNLQALVHAEPEVSP